MKPVSRGPGALSDVSLHISDGTLAQTGSVDPMHNLTKCYIKG